MPALLSPPLFDESTLRRRMNLIYTQMRETAKPQYFKNGRRKGQLCVAGIFGLPFTREEFWRHALAQVGSGTLACPYCEAIGRPANLITLADCVFDHKVPTVSRVSRIHAGRDLHLQEIWSLPNLVAVCADCNRLKGRASYPFFIGFMAALEAWEDARDRIYMHKCLRTQGKKQGKTRAGSRNLRRGMLKPAETSASGEETPMHVVF